VLVNTTAESVGGHWAVEGGCDGKCLETFLAVRDTKRLLFFRFPYVCPEPVLAKRSFLYKDGSKKGVVLFRTL
jgi:hypothetical protein